MVFRLRAETKHLENGEIAVRSEFTGHNSDVLNDLLAITENVVKNLVKAHKQMGDSSITEANYYMCLSKAFGDMAVKSDKINYLS